MDILEKAYDRACCESEDILNHQKLDKQDVELLGEFVDIIKDIEMIYDYRNKMDGYSQMNGSNYMDGRSGRMMPYMYSYNRGSSYGNDGEYSRTSNKDEMINHLQKVANMAMDDKDRKAVERLMEQMMQHQGN